MSTAPDSSAVTICGPFEAWTKSTPPSRYWPLFQYLGLATSLMEDPTL